ncbi:uncharacterized protein [Nicotiana tomentosiformis]|uniref:uncharacterized protein n=1 Tax=Nicotiana tomentosiformis TaxID=4098 RepID=UPI00388CA1BE
MELLKDYDITILYYPGKAIVVADALSRKSVSMGSIAYIPVGERPLALDAQALANQFMRLDVSEPSRVLACIFARSSLFERIRGRQDDDPHLLVLKDRVRHDGVKQVTVGDDRVLRMQVTYSSEWLADIYILENVRLHGVPMSSISDRDSGTSSG